MNNIPATLIKKILITLFLYILFISAVDIFQDKFSSGSLLINLLFLLFIGASLLRYCAGKAATSPKDINFVKQFRIIFYAYCAYAIFSNTIKYTTAQYDFRIAFDIPVAMALYFAMRSSMKYSTTPARPASSRP